MGFKVLSKANHSMFLQSLPHSQPALSMGRTFGVCPFSPEEQSHCSLSTALLSTQWELRLLHGSQHTAKVMDCWSCFLPAGKQNGSGAMPQGNANFLFYN